MSASTTAEKSSWVYADTSALVALFAKESTALGIRNWLNDESNVLCAADWCVTEVASALSVKVRSKTLAQEEADLSWAAFEQACQGAIELLPVLAQDFSRAAQLCRVAVSGLRAGDALHLAVALRQNCKQLLSFDRNLNINAQATGLKLVTL
jgi:uncharacterized protein